MMKKLKNIQTLIQDFKVSMRELCDKQNIDMITTSRIEELMEIYLGE